MKVISTREVAKRLGIHFTTLAQHIAAGKLPSPTIIRIGNKPVHAWTEKEVERARKLLPKIANGRKTRYQKKQLVHGAPGSSTVSSQQSVKSKSKTKKQPQARAPVRHKQRRNKK